MRSWMSVNRGRRGKDNWSRLAGAIFRQEAMVRLEMGWLWLQAVERKCLCLHAVGCLRITIHNNEVNGNGQAQLRIMILGLAFDLQM